MRNSPRIHFKKTSFIVLFICVCTGPLLSQQLSKRTESLRAMTNELAAQANYDSAQAVLLRFLEQKDLDNNEIFYGNYLSSYVLRSSGRIDEAIKLLFRSKKYLSNESPNKLESLLYGSVAECYFSLQQYDEAKKFALQSIKASPVSSLRNGGHTTNYSMIGYSCYVEKNYKRAQEYYDVAIQESITHGQYCELPLLYSKIAKAWQGLGKHDLALANIQRADKLSDSCGIDEYKLITRRSMFDIYYEAKEDKKALEELLLINDLVAKIESGSKEKLMNELQIQYESKLAERESDTLKELEKSKEELLTREKQLLYVTIISVIALSCLVFFLIRASTKRELVERKLVEANTSLDIKASELADKALD
jgi:tetratricopeptide (TPR) repeat protein